MVGCLNGEETHGTIAQEGEDNMTGTRIGVVTVALIIAFGRVLGFGSTQLSGKDQNLSGTIASFKRLADGKEWTTANLSVNTSSSYCYDDAEPNCRRYGRLYTWESAQRGCQSLGDGWRLPTDDEWGRMAKHYGGVGNDSAAPNRGDKLVLADDSLAVAQQMTQEIEHLGRERHQRTAMPELAPVSVEHVCIEEKAHVLSAKCHSTPEPRLCSWPRSRR